MQCEGCIVTEQMGPRTRVRDAALYAKQDLSQAEALSYGKLLGILFLSITYQHGT